ncbi:DNA-binding LacI/PurR family transcriptional regulator [Brevibacterium sanguinis]|uniref:DNA-binding LacI/PurR family transcriptional regulator n=2 Tax=Brevibacterium TaxID=1696 RepID=A0A366ILG6_9MICO|nr:MULTISPECIES: LacI family DNA-binding transcriptional regulator [Brevibacterium]RBP67032.1 DNA-binding LacI/PurR family transcriptional regulator [Brevibacterium sanguinis]RBP73557.1 DNA-binding LacI/PurR family transcriptional regulator [Brevibacterium celere]
MSSRRVTIVDIARELGISKSLVSNALHDRGRVSPATRELVRQTAQRLGYVSNRAAQQLRSARYGTVGLTIPSGVRALSFYMQTTLGVSDACSEIGSDLMLYTHVDERSRVSLNVPIDGAIVCDPQPDDHRIHQFTEARIPLVTIGDPSDAQRERVAASVSIDFSAVVAEVFRRLDDSSESTHPVLVVVDLPTMPVWLQEVEQAFARECRERGIPEREVRLPLQADDGFSSPASPRRIETSALRALVADLGEDTQSSWIVAYQGLASTLLSLATETASGQPPRIVAVPGDPMSDALDSRILSVDFRAHDYGATAVRLLHKALAGDDEIRNEVHRTSFYRA